MGKGQDWFSVRAFAESVMCPFCHSPAGVTCTAKDPLGNRVEVKNLAAHPVRVTAATAAAAELDKAGLADGPTGS